MKDIRRFPEAKPRVETGPVMFGNDWPGLFLRGDSAAYYALVIEAVLKRTEGTDTIDSISRIQLIGLVELFRESVITNVEPPEPKP